MNTTIGPMIVKLTTDAQRALSRRPSPQPTSVKPHSTVPEKTSDAKPVLPKGIPQTMSIKVMAYLDGKLVNTFFVTAAYNSDVSAVYDAALRTPYLSKRIAEGKTAERGVFHKNESLTIRLRTPERTEKDTKKAEFYYRILVYIDGNEVNAFYVAAPRGSDMNTVLHAALRNSSMQRYQEEFRAEPSDFTPNSSLKINLVRRVSRKPVNETQKVPEKSADEKSQYPAWKRFLVWAPSLTSALFFLTHFNKLESGNETLSTALLVFACLLIAANGIIWLGKTYRGCVLSSIVIGINAPFGFFFMLYYILQVFGKDLLVLYGNLFEGHKLIVGLVSMAYTLYTMIIIGFLADLCAIDLRQKKQ